MESTESEQRSPLVPSRILFLNDVGFQYGAGIAQARQIQSLLNLKVEVGAIAWAPGGIDLQDVATQPVDLEFWLGIREVKSLEGGKKISDQTVIEGLLAEISKFSPQTIIVGNLHAASWPLQLLPALQAFGCRVIAFMHDAYLYTGRCAYPGPCNLYLTGCNETCPTATEYPALAPARIHEQWQLRRDVFSGPNGVEIVANSYWSQRKFQTAIPGCRHIETAYLGSDEEVFKPGDKKAARAHLGLPNDKPIVLCAAVNFQEKRKGSHYLIEIIAALKDSVCFAAFGHNAEDIPGMFGLGYHINANQLAICYQAADLFLGTATEEAFGQTILEAQMCGLPVVAFNTGGVSEIVRNEITGKLVKLGDTEEAISAINLFLGSDHLIQSCSLWSNHYATHRFSLYAQMCRWHTYFDNRPVVGTGQSSPSLSYPLEEEENIKSTSRHRPSWTSVAPFISEEHSSIFEATSHIEGWQVPGDTFKLYEMGYHSGDVILEIGTYGGRSATAAIRGGLANHERTLYPQYYGIDIDADAISRTRQSLADEMIAHHCHLFHGNLNDFILRWDITPTMIFLDGDHTYEGVVADLVSLTKYIKQETPLLIHDFLSEKNQDGTYGVKKASQEWEAAGHGKFLGCFGCSALYLTQNSES